jgi:hypothetical protein
MKHIDEDIHEWRARMARGGAGAPKPKCKTCDGKGWRFRTPDGFNPFSAGGWNTINAIFRVPCGDCREPHVRDGEGNSRGEQKS